METTGIRFPETVGMKEFSNNAAKLVNHIDNLLKKENNNKMLLLTPVRLSPSVSYNPARYGGLQSLFPRGEKLLRCTHTTAHLYSLKFSENPNCLFKSIVGVLEKVP